MTRSATILVVASLATLSQSASAGTMTLSPGGGSTLCTPEMDTNHDGICDWRDTITPGGGGGVVIVNPSGGSIEPDPTGMPGLIYNDVDLDGEFSLWAKTRWDGRGATYTELLASLPHSERYSVGMESVDLDGDGTLDAIVGDPTNDVLDEDAGAVYVFYGPLTNERPLDPRDADAVIFGTVAHGAFGASIHAVEGGKGQVLLQVNSSRDGVALQFSGDRLPEKSDEGQPVETGLGGSWGWE